MLTITSFTRLPQASRNVVWALIPETGVLWLPTVQDATAAEPIWEPVFRFVSVQEADPMLEPLQVRVVEPPGCTRLGDASISIGPAPVHDPPPAVTVTVALRVTEPPGPVHWSV